MAAKVGGIYVSLALNTAEFSDGVGKSVAEMRKFDKLQADMEKATSRVNAQITQQASVLAQLALQGTRLGPMIALIATGTQQYYMAMKRAAGENAAFSRSGASVSALLQSMRANWIALVVQVAKYGIDKILEWQLAKAQKVADAARAQADAIEKRTERGRKSYARDLEAQYNAALGIEKKITIATIAEEAVRTKNYAEGRLKAAELIARDAAKKAAEDRKRTAQAVTDNRNAVERAVMGDTARQIAEINDKYDELIEKAGKFGSIGEFNANLARLNLQRQHDIAKVGFEELSAIVAKQNAEYESAQDRIRDAESKRLTFAQKMVQAWRDQIALATRYAGLVVGRASGAYSAMLGSMEAMGRVPGMPAMATGMSSPAMQFDSRTIEAYLRVIADAARKELTL